MKHYQPNRKGFIVYLLGIFIIIPITACLLDNSIITDKPFILLPLLSPFLLVLWIYVSTTYRIDNTTLYYKSGFLRGKVEISKIREILKGKTMWSGTAKAAMAKNGLIIKYNKYDEVYIAPVSNEKMIEDLLTVNSNIKISE
tara:strand:+ start:906 stop:1331 length:426 start_codon:yes stop_codon:yes gene_type:complete